MNSLLLIVAAICCTQAKIDGPDKVDCYKLVRLIATGAFDSAVWFIDPEATSDVYESGKDFVFTGPPGTYTIKCVTIKGTKLEKANKKVVIGSDPQPGPDPNPEPGPSKLQLIIIYDPKTLDTDPNLAHWVRSKTLDNYLKPKGHELIALTVNAVDQNGTQRPDFAGFLNAAKGLTPYFFVQSGKKAIAQGKLKPDMLAEIKKYGG